MQSQIEAANGRWQAGIWFNYVNNTGKFRFVQKISD